MKKNLAAIFVALVSAMAGLPPGAGAEGVKAGDLVLYQAWARASAGRSTTGAVYISIHNHGSAQRLLSAETPAADQAKLHTHLMKDGVLRMRHLENIEVQEKAMTELKPGGFHLMLMRLKAPLREGETFPLTLVFDKAGPAAVTVKVMKVGSMGPKGPHHGTGSGIHNHDEKHEHGTGLHHKHRK